ncbi:class I adenylate-forming enzyme family protein [Carboxylicivirga sp. M1479]|uniref:class I adenylate-forming enzyme family protein n=1 Tax=Carboxylicivirga sp. M1479 TaxID=2594476 RepID=UPI001177B427|nr:class I adenylate-forming enzyme family protein [Carboxylicivirga sp. M1479]TRX66342.1 acyl--CoA ligase [Carboxylicivirga sp. M1479]
MNCIDFLLKDHLLRKSDFVIGRTDTLAYSQLICDILKLAEWFRLNVGQGKNVVLIMPNSNDFIICYLAIMKSGNVVVPLNPAIEKDTCERIMQCCDAKYLFASQQLINRIQPTSEYIFNQSDLSTIIASSDEVNWKDSTQDLDDLAQIIFTSGSTAEPKGVMISHRNIIANTRSIVEYLALSQHDTMEVVLPFFYCYGLSLLHTHLKVGGKIVLNNTFIFLSSVISDLIKYKCTGFAGVPSHFQILLRKSKEFKTTDFPDLRYVTQAGGKLHTAFIEEFKKSKSKVDLFVMYGQTEATARLSYLPPLMLDKKMGSIGKGIPDVELRVVNAQGSNVNPDEIGEIIAKGDNVMLGYYKDPEETSQTIKNGWLYTGDMARIDQDGFIFHAARRKEIIKVGGRRVSPKEIEEVIVGLEGVVDCTIEAVADELLGEAIKAIVVVNNETISADDIKRECAMKLSNYKVPQHIVFSDKMQVNAAGKKTK